MSYSIVLAAFELSPQGVFLSGPIAVAVGPIQSQVQHNSPDLEPPFMQLLFKKGKTEKTNPSNGSGFSKN